MVTVTDNAVCVVSIFSIFIIMFERYYVICRPLIVRSVITRSHVLKIIFAIWWLSILINLPFIALTDYEQGKFYDNSTGYKCAVRISSNRSELDWGFFYVLLVHIVIYFLIGVILIYMHYKIMIYLKNSHGLLLNHSSLNAILVNKPISINENTGLKSNNSSLKNSISLNEISKSRSKPNNLIHSVVGLNNTNLEKYLVPRRQLIFMLTCVCVIFYVCLLPVKVWTIVFMFFGHKPEFPRIIDLRTFWYINITSEFSIKFFFLFYI
jgi:hypothetical protein